MATEKQIRANRENAKKKCRSQDRSGAIEVQQECIPTRPFASIGTRSGHVREGQAAGAELGQRGAEPGDVRDRARPAGPAADPHGTQSADVGTRPFGRRPPPIATVEGAGPLRAHRVYPAPPGIRNPSRLGMKGKYRHSRLTNESGRKNLSERTQIPATYAKLGASIFWGFPMKLRACLLATISMLALASLSQSAHAQPIRWWPWAPPSNLITSYPTPLYEPLGYYGCFGGYCRQPVWRAGRWHSVIVRDRRYLN